MGYSESNLEPVVLIVEDDEFNYFLLEKLMKKAGIYHEWVKSTSEAKNRLLCSNNKIETVLIDAMYQSPNGYETAQLIKRIKPSVQIIAHTAYRPVGVNKHDFEKPFDQILYKPCNSQEIMNAVLNAKSNNLSYAS